MIYGRYTYENLRLISDILLFNSFKNLAGFIFKVDFQKRNRCGRMIYPNALVFFYFGLKFFSFSLYTQIYQVLIIIIILIHLKFIFFKLSPLKQTILAVKKLAISSCKNTYLSFIKKCGH